MKRHTQEILYHLLPAIFWLLAIGGSVLPMLLMQLPADYWHGYVVSALVLLGIFRIGLIKRHESAVEPCFQVALLVGFAAYWLPTVVFLTIPIWGYLFYRHLFDMRVFIATLLGFGLVAVWAVLLSCLLPETFFLSPLTSHLYLWIPAGAILLAWLASTIARQTLRVR